jgi:hypothetical protein
VLRLGRRWGERGLGRDMRPYRLHHRLEDWDGNAAAGCAVAQREALAIGIVVAEPYCNRHFVAEADEPGIVPVIGGAGLAGDIRRETGDRARGAARLQSSRYLRTSGQRNGVPGVLSTT